MGRLFLAGVVSLLPFAACSPQSPAIDDPAKPSEIPGPDAAASEGKVGIGGSMKSNTASNDAANLETADGFTFQTFPAQIESVHLPTRAGSFWSATVSDADLLAVGRERDDKMPNGTMHHVVKVTSKRSGNVTVKFERRSSADAAGKVLETRTVNFVIHVDR